MWNAGDAFEQGRFPGRVRPDDRNQFSSPHRRRRYIFNEELSAVIGADRLKLQGYHERLLLEMMSEKKKGTPTRAVMIPIGKTTPGTIDFETIEVTESSNAPDRIDPGRKNR